MKQKTSLERSHSAWSNTKLSVICGGLSIVFSAIFVVLAFHDKLPTIVFYVAVGVLSLATLTFLHMLSRFTR